MIETAAQLDGVSGDRDLVNREGQEDLEEWFDSSLRTDRIGRI
jgi:hypothetical protein